MGQLRDRMEADLRLTGYSPSTRKIDLGHARLFAKDHMRSPAELSEDHLQLKGFADIDPLTRPLPHGTEVSTRVDRIVGERRVAVCGDSRGMRRARHSN